MLSFFLNFNEKTPAKNVLFQYNDYQLPYISQKGVQFRKAPQLNNKTLIRQYILIKQRNYLIRAIWTKYSNKFILKNRETMVKGRNFGGTTIGQL